MKRLFIAIALVAGLSLFTATTASADHILDLTTLQPIPHEAPIDPPPTFEERVAEASALLAGRLSGARQDDGAGPVFGRPDIDPCDYRVCEVLEADGDDITCEVFTLLDAVTVLVCTDGKTNVVVVI